LKDLKASEFNDVLKEHEGIIYYLIQRLGIRDPEKEFYQEGVIALWRAVETYNEERGKFSTYAYFLVEKALLSLIRKRNRQTEVEEVYKVLVASDERNVSSSFQLNFDFYLLNQMEQVLTEKQMKWFTLFVLQDLSIKEIAAKEQVTIVAVKNWARHAKAKIKRLLDEE
jgi:RNA polymerase sigma factor (sigma-70 family)